MKTEEKRTLAAGILLVAFFVIWTWLIQTVDVQPRGVKGTDIGFAELNCEVHRLTGVHMTLYTITDWLGLVPVAAGMVFAVLGGVQLVKRRSLLKVDTDIILLGLYYVVVIAGYLIFEMIPINYRPVLIEGRMEASYPSSTTLLVLSVMPTLVFQLNRRVKNKTVRKTAHILTSAFCIFMVGGRLICGVHWITDIVGSVALSAGLFCIYKAAVMKYCKEIGGTDGIS